MAALTQDRETPRKEGILLEYPVAASTTIYKGSIVMVVTGTGYAVPGANTANGVVIGVATEKVDNSSGSDGDLTVEVERKGLFKFAASSIAITDVGKAVFVVDDQTFDETDPGNSVSAGKLVKYESATLGWIDLGL